MDRRISLKYPLIFIIFTLTFLLGGAFCVNAEEDELEMLPAEKAFTLQAALLDNEQVKLNFRIVPGYFLYQKHFKFRTLEGKALNEPSIFPPALVKEDDVLGEKYQVYAKQLSLVIPQASTNQKGLRVQYQGCSETGFCFAPTAKEIIFQTNGKAIIKEISVDEFNAENLNPALTGEEVGSELDRITNQLKTGTLPWTLLFFLGLGLLLAFTPCVLPMVPILANILVGENAPLSGKRATLLASLYILSVATCYAMVGTIAGLMGYHLQATLQKPIFLVSFSFVLLLFALSQLNLVHIQLPQVFAHTLHNLQRKQKQGSVIGAVAMGGLSALMVSPCVTPALVGALTYIGQTGNALLGGAALFAMAIGMGLPLLCVASLGSHLLPKTGSWMTYVKTATGILLFILAVTILMRAFPNTPHESTADLAVQFTPIQNETELQQALKAAKLAKKAVILDVYADWCVSCQHLDQELFNNKKVSSVLKDTHLLRLDVTKLSADNELLQKHLQIVGPPTLLFFNMEGNELKNYRLIGKIEFDPFLKHVNHFLTTSRINE